MNVFKLNPYIRLTSKFSVLQAYCSIARRIIFDYELIYIKSGKFTLEYDGKNYACNQGDILLIRPGVQHAFFIGETPVAQPHVHFDMEFLPNSPEIPVCFKKLEELSDLEKACIRQDLFANYPSSPFITIKDKEKFLQLLDVVLTGRKVERYLEKKGALTAIISMIAEDNFSESFSYPNDYPIETQLKDYIDAGQCFSLTLSQIADQFSYDKFYLEKKFKCAFGQSIIAYRNEKRLIYAKSLLKDYNVSQVAEKTGFSSIYSFSRAYKLRFGKSPTK
jgi:AraC-like DNA-binding protein